jgi:hypothetical protein
MVVNAEASDIACFVVAVSGEDRHPSRLTVSAW